MQVKDIDNATTGNVASWKGKKKWVTFVMHLEDSVHDKSVGGNKRISHVYGQGGMLVINALKL